MLIPRGSDFLSVTLRRTRLTACPKGCEKLLLFGDGLGFQLGPEGGYHLADRGQLLVQAVMGALDEFFQFRHPPAGRRGCRCVPPAVVFMS